MCVCIFICYINIEGDICNKHSTTICSEFDVKIRKVKQTKSKAMVQNLKDSEMKLIMKCHLLQVTSFLQTYVPPTKAKIGENLKI